MANLWEIPRLVDIWKMNSKRDLAYWVQALLWDRYFDQQYKEREMLKLVVNNEDEIQIKPKPGGKGPTDGDWLSDMVSGTEFICHQRQAAFSWLLTEFTHGGKINGTVLLIPTATLNDRKTWIWVDPVEFCRAFELKTVLEVPDTE